MPEPDNDYKGTQNGAVNSDDRFGVGSSRGESVPVGAEKQDSSDKPSGNGATNNGEVEQANRTREVIIGGIRRQVNAIQQAYLAYVHSHRERLQKRLAESYEQENEFLSEIHSINEQIRQLIESEE